MFGALEQDSKKMCYGALEVGFYLSIEFNFNFSLNLWARTTIEKTLNIQSNLDKRMARE